MVPAPGTHAIAFLKMIKIEFNACVVSGSSPSPAVPAPPANFNFEGKKCSRVVVVWCGQPGLDVPLHASNTTEHQQGTGPQGL